MMAGDGKVVFRNSSSPTMLPLVHGGRAVADQGSNRRAGGLAVYNPSQAVGASTWKGRHGLKGHPVPSLASSSAIRQMDIGGRAHFSMFPSKPSVKEAPMLLQKMEGMIKASGLFEDEDEPWHKSRARLDVLRVVFAMYCDSAKVYKPILGMIQREYEAQISALSDAQSKMHVMEDDLATDKDVYHAKESELKGRWKAKLKKANDAVNEWKGLYEELDKKYRADAALIGKMKDDMLAMQEKVDELDADCNRAYEDNERLAKECNSMRFDVERSQDLQRDKTLLQAQVQMLSSQIADFKTEKEVQHIHVMKQTREHAEQQKQIAKLQKEVAEYVSDREALTPRPALDEIATRLAKIIAEPPGRTHEMIDLLVTELEPYQDNITFKREEAARLVVEEAEAAESEVQPGG